MKSLLLFISVFSLISCGGSSSGGGNSKKPSNQPTQEQITQSINSNEGLLLITNTWCATEFFEDDNGNGTYIEIELDFLSSGKMNIKMTDLNNPSTPYKTTEYWYISGNKLMTTDEGSIEATDFSVTYSSLEVINTTSEEDGVLVQEAMLFTACF
jgi:hypothetical protein